MKKALITGITGQDGSYLAEFLLSKGYEVYGMYRRTSIDVFDRLEHIKDKIHLVDGDLIDEASLIRILIEVKPDEVYNLASQSFVPHSWTQPIATAEMTGLGVLRVLEAIRLVNPKIKFYQASSSEIFGKALETPQNEKTPFYPRSPYGAAKVYGYWMTVNYRESYNIFACNGILFNHESPRRGKQFVTRKITHSVAKIKLGMQEHFELGNLDSKRDWGFAGDYCIDLDTSILTAEGFKYYDEVQVGDSILNYNLKTNCLEHDKIIKKFLLNNNGKMYLFSGRGLKLRCSNNHRIYYQMKSKTSKGGWSDWKCCEAKDFYGMLKNLKLRTRYDYRLPPTQGYKNKDLKINNNWFKLIGYLLSEGNVYAGNRTLRISISQSKVINKRIYKDIKFTLKGLGLVHRIRERADGVVDFVFNAHSSKKIISYFDGFDIHTMPKWVYGAGDRQLKILLKAMMDGDGCWGVMTYISKRKDLISSFQTIASILGYRTIISQRKSGMWGCVLIAPRKKYAYITDAEEQKSREKVWCITTRNGTIVTNKEGGIAVSGNCKAMWLMLQREKPDDYVISSGETHSVREFVEAAFECVGIKIKWEGSGMNEVGKADGKILVKVNPKFYRPAEVDLLLGDSSKARNALGWKPEVNFKQLVKMMVEHDLEILSKGLK